MYLNEKNREIIQIEEASADLSFDNNTPFILEFNKQPLIHAETSNPFALISFK